MDYLDLPSQNHDQHTFYLSSCESAAGIDTHDSNISSRHSSLSSNSSANIDSSTQIKPIYSNTFFTILKRSYYLSNRRKKHGRYRSLSSSLHLFFKKHHQQYHHEHQQYQSINDFLKSSSCSHVPTVNNQFTRSQPIYHSCQHIYSRDKIQNQISNSKMHDFQRRRSFLRRMKHSDKTVSEDNNTHTLSSVDLALTPVILPTHCQTESNSLITPVQQLNLFDLQSVSRELYCLPFFFHNINHSLGFCLSRHS